MALKNRKKTRNTLKRASATEDSDSSGSTSTSLYLSRTVYAHDSGEEEVVKWGYILLLICWLIFVGGIGGVLGIWDRVFGFDENRIVDLACYFSLIVVTGFTWTVLNWYHTPLLLAPSLYVSVADLFPPG
ncbi:protein of unknown function [Taphrina deformans PYCC 5710]|uniref:Uncharacterized protein n=1 Tax=Taphrina deformans (strain PYCC 5710 / ATCC 11124 / CBS 356.35 / IMI 108563 / JCM 9778 / NBRC 8474) TaxID=1097556 RepID=R4XHT2_TAPDE|nr:protein of unknown function [Taphrina deformans PYCC 5710]|eukprot:CCG84073.1 protein of unknown function [Taphrina deformans PYCC 5710]